MTPRNVCRLQHDALLQDPRTRLLLFLIDVSALSVKMWGVCFSPRLPARAASRLCHSKPAKPSSSSSLLESQRPKAEKQRRRREREEAVFTRQRNVSGEGSLQFLAKSTFTRLLVVLFTAHLTDAVHISPVCWLNFLRQR